MNDESKTDKQAEIDRLALAYAKLTGLKVSHRGIFDHRTRSWYEFIKAGFTVHDLERVVLFLKHKILTEGWPKSMLNFSYLIERLDRLEEWNEQAKAEVRNKRPEPTPLDKVQEQFSPKLCPEPVVQSWRHVSEVIAAMREAAK